MGERSVADRDIPSFDRVTPEGTEPFSRIGSGAIGGKAHGLVTIISMIESRIGAETFPGLELYVPSFTVIGTDVFDDFMDRNDLGGIASSDEPDERIAHAFQQADLPVEIVGDLRAIVDRTHEPLAVRSSSLLEDSLHRPFAGVYGTKMTPNNQHDSSERFRKLVEAVKYVFASTYFRCAKDYLRIPGREPPEEKMAVIIQEVVGRRLDDRFYPEVSGVGRTHDFYATDGARAREGVVNLALGLGKTIVDGSLVWTYCPARPRTPPPFGSVRDLMQNTQTKFWAVNMGALGEFDPIRETEYLVQGDLAAADYDGTLSMIASTYDAEAERIWPGAGGTGPRVLNFAPLLDTPDSIPFNDAVTRMLAASRETLGNDAEIEFAMTLPARGGPAAARLAFLQVRPMFVSDERVEITDESMKRPDVLVASDRVMGNGVQRGIHDIVFVKPSALDLRRTHEIAAQLDRMNEALVAEERPYLLLGFGRWGTTDEWAGIPVSWNNIRGARVIVEAALPDKPVDMSHGSHFFLNVLLGVARAPAGRRRDRVHRASQPGDAPARDRRRQDRTRRGLARWGMSGTSMMKRRGDKSMQPILDALQERAKELNCLYRVDEILSRSDVRTDDVFRELVRTLPHGWQYPDICEARLTIDREVYRSSEIQETPWIMAAEIFSQGEHVGEIAVYYTQERPDADEGPFLKQERRLISAIADRIGLSVMQQRLRRAHQSWETVLEEGERGGRHSWSVLLDFLARTDPDLLARLTRKMINHLCWSGDGEAEALLQESFSDESWWATATSGENRPLDRDLLHRAPDLTGRTFDAAGRHLSEQEIIVCIQAWINEEKSTFLIKSLENPGSGLADVSRAIERFESAAIDEADLPLAVQTSLKVALLRRFFVDQMDFINAAKRFVEVKDFYDLVRHLVHPVNSQGKLGGKGAGLFLADQVIGKSAECAELCRNLKVPKTWYVASDGLLEFVHHNNLEEVYNRKYMDVEPVRRDYHHIIQVFKGSHFPPDMVRGLATALDDFEDRPLIVRSSSLLEDRVGSAFSGKYKSLFLANQGSKKDRLAALMDAIAEVYASVFAPDPIEYRAERGLLDFREEMGILIQEVVGRRVGPYFAPAFSGVAFSNNEFRWSARIRREDGLVRMVPGLGTRAVDRMSDDYPVLFSPGQPALRVNVSADEVVRYSPRRMDVLNLETNAFETIEVADFLRDYGESCPYLRNMVSVLDGDRIRQPSYLEPDWDNGNLIVTFQGLIEDGPFVAQIQSLLTVLREKIRFPVDIEFTHDGENLYLVQCRTQSSSKEHAPAAIPRNIPPEGLLFSANRHISNGGVPEITHLVYVDPDEYGRISDPQDLRRVGRAVGKLNRVLPKRQFILMGPGRWGSRGDIRLGVNVTYSEINNTAVLIEIARRTGEYLPELSFGTHFFQDLVEAEIRYLPLYPDEEETVLNEAFIRRSQNMLAVLAPEFSGLSNVVRVIDVPKETGGQILRVLMNADLDEAVGVFAPRVIGTSRAFDELVTELDPIVQDEDHWRWRLEMAEQIGRRLEADRFGVKALYVIGSTKNGTAGPCSDIDLLVHDDGDAGRRAQLTLWLDGWSQSLSEINYLRTGYKLSGLLDVKFLTDEDIERQTSYAVKIGAVTDAARGLALGDAAE
jgi:hypothetical protein